MQGGRLRSGDCAFSSMSGANQGIQMIDIKAIRAAAEAATPGPWIAAGPSFGEPLPKYINCVLVENEDGDADDVCIAPIGCDAISTKDLTFIATANPATVIALCDEIERLRKDAAAYHAIMAELDMQMKAIK